MIVRNSVAAALARIAATAVLGGLACTALVRFSPGFGVDEKQLDASLSHASQQALRRSHDGERNALAFYAGFWQRVLAGDLGFSQSLNRPIGELLRDRAPATAALAIGGIGYAWVIAILLSLPCLAPALGGSRRCRRY